MNTAKVAVLEETLKYSFDVDRYRKFTREFFNKIDMYPESKKTGIWREYEEQINSYYTIGKYTDSENSGILIMAVELKNEKSVERARSMQRNFISKVLDENNLDAAIVAFYSENEPSWRLSFVRLDYTFTDKGLDIDLTPAKRYSYIVGTNEPSYTAQTQLLKILEDDTKNPSLDEIEDAFSVEKVTKDFFVQYKEKYLELKEYLESNSEFIIESEKLGFETDKFAEQFAKKLMGQLAFLYFLQKKGWLGVRIVPKSISKQELTQVYNSADDVEKKTLEKVYKGNDESKYDLDIELISSNAFSEHEAGILSGIFISNEKHDKPWGSGYRKFIRDVLWRHCDKSDKNFFNDYLEPFFYDALNKKRKNQYFKTFNSKIPFLNGGLFEPLEGYHWKDTNFKIPNEIFSNKEEKAREADGILDIFDRYNFTINENEPLEKEVAVDPEMLGKIFENLLDVNDRKSKGAFYTPREIVHYMCQESLINYLVNEVNVPYEDMKQFILYGEIIKDADSRSVVASSENFEKNKTIKQSVFDNIVTIDQALENVKVADPAVGSGAFPLGMLNEIVRARNNITEYIIRVDKERPHGERYGEERIREARSQYKIKWNTIKNSIFAVDIEASAVDITKLRLWLSVIVDQDINDEYKEPRPLPNLDMNIHVGNSLINEFEGIKLFDETILTRLKGNNEDEKNNSANKGMQLNLLIDQTDEMLKEMFDLQERYFEIDNEERKKEIKYKIDNIQEQLIRYKLDRDGNDEGLNKYDESLKNKTKPYFIWELEFGKVFKDKGGFDIVIGNPPYVQVKKGTYSAQRFIYSEGKDKGKQNLYKVFVEHSYNLNKTNGITCLIVQSSLMCDLSSTHTRELLLKNTEIHQFIEFPKKSVDIKGQVFESVLQGTCICLFQKTQVENNTFKLSIGNNINTINQLDFETIKQRQILSLYPQNMYIPLIKNGEFRIMEKVLKKSQPMTDLLLSINQGDLNLTTAKNKISLNISKVRLLRGKNIGRYITSNKGEEYVSDEFMSEKVSMNREHTYIVGQEITGTTDRWRLHFSLTDNTYDFLFGHTANKILLKEENKNYFVLGVLNSKLQDWFFRKTSTNNHVMGYELQQLPIPNIDKKLLDIISNHTEEITVLKKEGKDTEGIEKTINGVIYNFYDLTKEEIKIVEGN